VQLDLARTDSAAALGAVNGMLSLLAEDVVFLRAGAPIVYGREAARRLLEANQPAAGTTLTWQPLGGELSGDHRSAYTYGVAARVSKEGEPNLDLARYIAFWKRDGSVGAMSGWRITAYSDVSTAQAPAANPTPEDVAQPVRQLSKRAAELTAKLRTTDSAFSDLADRMGLAEAFGTYAAPDGAILSEGELVIGPRALRDFFAATNGGLALTWQPMFSDVAASEDLAFTVGDYIATLRGPSGAAVQRFGKYMTVWKRQRDGSWKFVMDGGSSRPRGA
jgi:ketosteroid isomerase-like protein